MIRFLPLAVSFLLLSIWTRLACGHGRLIDPPSRSSMWRFGFKTRHNYNDNELFCGGFQVQWEVNKGKCGICGDAWNAKPPRDNEAGGIYGTGIIVKTYKTGQVLNAVVDITANHLGYFLFKLCVNNNPEKDSEQECFDKYSLPLADGSGYKYWVNTSRTGLYNVALKLPDGLQCEQCVLQWTYSAGNNWGWCSDGVGRLGCGPQETFRGCSDIRITDKDITESITEISKNTNEDITRKQFSMPTSFTTEKRKKFVHQCHPVGIWKTVFGMNTWCVNNCVRGYCPPSHCVCET